MQRFHMSFKCKPWAKNVITHKTAMWYGTARHWQRNTGPNLLLHVFTQVCATLHWLCVHFTIQWSHNRLNLEMPSQFLCTSNLWIEGMLVSQCYCLFLGSVLQTLIFQLTQEATSVRCHKDDWMCKVNSITSCRPNGLLLDHINRSICCQAKAPQLTPIKGTSWLQMPQIVCNSQTMNCKPFFNHMYLGRGTTNPVMIKS